MRSLIICSFVLLELCSPVLAAAVTPMLSAGASFSLALQPDGTVVAWGDNTYGALGDGTTTTRYSPVAVSGLTDIVSVSVGGKHAAAVKADGTVYTWGNNSSGQLGNGTVQNSVKPAIVPGLTNVISVSAGYAYTLALKADGTVVAWGDNTGGELGNATTTTSVVPVFVTGLTNVVAISAAKTPATLSYATQHSVALKADGTVVTWGDNSLGELGDGTSVSKAFPVTVPGLNGVVAVSAAGTYVVALKADGTVVGWGYNLYGTLGVNVNVSFASLINYSPVVIEGLSDIVSISAGEFFLMALKADGTLVARGDNSIGQLGNGTKIYSNSLERVTGINNVAAIAAGNLHTLAQKTDGTVWGWGDNAYGELGNGTKVSTATPTSIGFNLSAATTPLLNSTVFSYAESNYASLFPATATSMQYLQYHYRQYSNGNLLGINTTGEVFAQGGFTNNELRRIGKVSDFAAAISAWKGL